MHVKGSEEGDRFGRELRERMMVFHVRCKVMAEEASVVWPFVKEICSTI